MAIAKEEQRRIEAFETWCYRRILKFNKTEIIINEEVLRKMSERSL